MTIVLGAYVSSSTRSQQDAFEAFETRGGELYMTRHYLTNWQDDFTWGFIRWSAGDGNIPYVSLHCAPERGGANPTWRSVADGNWDAFLTDMANELDGLGVPFYFAFHHEPENDANAVPDEMLASDFKNAATHVYTLMSGIASDGIFGTVLLRNTFNGRNGGANAWLPAADHMDFVGSDLYSRDGATQLSALAAAPLAKARSLSKPFVIGEAGVGGGARAKATWLRNARTYLKANADIDVFDYSETVALGSDYLVETNSTVLTAWRAITADTYFRPPS